MNFIRKLFRVCGWLFFLSIVAICGIFYATIYVWKTKTIAEVEIPSGMSVKAIGEHLAQHHVLQTPHIFAWWVRLSGVQKELKAGLYEFPAGLTLKEITDMLVRGDVKYVPLTIIEGWNLQDIIKALREHPFLVQTDIPQQFAELAYQPEFVASLGFPEAKTLEGYLFPETYKISRPNQAQDLIRHMVDHFREVYGELDQEKSGALGLTQHQLVTLASIVEKETGRDEERPIIASVFYNRLRVFMPLQSDPTIIYGLEHFDGNLRKQDLSSPHPYNTYVHTGLPPGPICNPGRASLAAVLSPAQTDYLYFVSRNDGTHQFSKTLSEHVRGVMEYQVKQR